MQQVANMVTSQGAPPMLCQALSKTSGSTVARALLEAPTRLLASRQAPAQRLDTLACVCESRRSPALLSCCPGLGPGALLALPGLAKSASGLASGWQQPVQTLTCRVGPSAGVANCAAGARRSGRSVDSPRLAVRALQARLSGGASPSLLWHSTLFGLSPADEFGGVRPAPHWPAAERAAAGAGGQAGAGLPQRAHLPLVRHQDPRRSASATRAVQNSCRSAAQGFFSGLASQLRQPVAVL